MGVRNQNSPLRHKTLAATQRLYVSGEIVRKPCVACDFGVVTIGHHVDYHKPRLLIWLCQSCHRVVHRIIRFRWIRQVLGLDEPAWMMRQFERHAKAEGVEGAAP